MNSIVNLISNSIDKTSSVISSNLEVELNQIDEEMLKLSSKRLTIINILKLLGKDPDLNKLNLSFLKSLIQLLEQKGFSKADIIEKMKEFSPFDIIKSVNWLISNKYLNFENDIVSIGFKFPFLNKFLSK